MMKISFEYILIKWKKPFKIFMMRSSINLIGNRYILILSKKLILSKNK